MTYEERMKKAINGLDIAEVVQTAIRDEENEPVKKLVVRVRVQSQATEQWISVIDFILQEEEDQDEVDVNLRWSAHCCKTYLRVEGRLSHVWNITIATRNDLKVAVETVSRAIRTLAVSLKSIQLPVMQRATSSRVQGAASRVARNRNNSGISVVRRGNFIDVEEMPLFGAGNRNKPGPGEKGAYYLGETGGFYDKQ